MMTTKVRDMPDYKLGVMRGRYETLVDQQRVTSMRALKHWLKGEIDCYGEPLDDPDTVKARALLGDNIKQLTITLRELNTPASCYTPGSLVDPRD